MRLFFALFSIFLCACVSAPLTNFDVTASSASSAATQSQLLASSAGEKNNLSFQKWQLAQSGVLPFNKNLFENSGICLIDPKLFKLKSDALILSHNDSFSNNKIFAISYSAPNNFKHEFESDLTFLANNFDWEDICAIDKNRVVISDSGDNWHIRRFLDLYFLEFEQNKTLPTVKKYQAHFPACNKIQYNYDCESIFYRNGFLYFVTKEDGGARLFSIEITKLKSNKIVPLSYNFSFEISGRATAADYNSEINTLAILSYSHLYIYNDLDKNSKELSPKSLLALQPIALPYQNGFEALCFLSNEEISIASEKGDFLIYRLVK